MVRDYKKDKAKKDTRAASKASGNTHNLRTHFGAIAIGTTARATTAAPRSVDNENGNIDVNNNSRDTDGGNNNGGNAGNDTGNSSTRNSNENAGRDNDNIARANTDNGNTGNNNGSNNSGGGNINGGNNNGEGNNNDDEGGGEGSRSSVEYWEPHVMSLFKKMTAEVDEAVEYTGRGSMGKYLGEFPDKYDGLITPSVDPVRFFKKDILLSMIQFCHPHYIIWFPEAMFPRMYPYAKPKCPWHNMSECVCLNGWCDAPRRGHASNRATAIVFKKYYCNRNGKNDLKYFRGIDKRVLAMMPDYVKGVFEKLGFDFSH